MDLQMSKRNFFCAKRYKIRKLIILLQQNMKNHTNH
jgi:hypothetical protein